MTMTDERLAELDAVMAKATDGNWGWCAAGARLYASPKGAMYSANVLLVHDPKWQANETDRAAIVALHNVYPDLRAHIDEQAATIARLTGAAKSLLALCEQAGLADDLLAAVFPDSKNRSGQTRDETAKQARRTMNEARAALSEDGQ